MGIFRAVRLVVINPPFLLMLALFFQTLNLYARSSDEKSEKSVPADCIQLVLRKTTGGVIDPRLQKQAIQDLGSFQQEHKNFPQIDGLDNARFMQFLESDQRYLFFEAEIAILKELNDVILNNKDLASALTNYFKELFYQELARDSYFSGTVVAKYNDYKSIRFIFNRLDAKFKLLLKALYKKTAHEFTKFVESSSSLKTLYSKHRGLAISPLTWNLAGMCGSEKIKGSLDLAGLATRFARSLFDKRQKKDTERMYRKNISAAKDHRFIEAQDCEEIEFDLMGNLRAVEQLRVKIQKGFALQFDVPSDEANQEEIQELLREESFQAGLFTNLDEMIKSGAFVQINASNPPEYFLSVAAIEIFRKPKASNFREYVHFIKNAFRNRFRVDLSVSQIIPLRTYFNAVNLMSPGLIQPERTPIDLSKATHGILSVDIAGQGAINHFYNQLALFKARNAGLGEAVRLMREGERESTKVLDERRRKIIEAFSSVIFKKGVPEKFRSAWSGDDMILFPDHDLTETELLELSNVNSTLERDLPGKQRIVHLSKYVPDASKKIVAAEKMEKSMRSLLEASYRYQELKTTTLLMSIDANSADDSAISIFQTGELDPTFHLFLKDIFHHLDGIKVNPRIISNQTARCK